MNFSLYLLLNTLTTKEIELKNHSQSFKWVILVIIKHHHGPATLITQSRFPPVSLYKIPTFFFTLLDKLHSFT